MCLIDFRNFLTIHVFGVKESIADISTELPCLGHVTSCYVMSRNSRNVTSCCVMSRNFTLCHVKPRHVTSCHVMSHHVTSCHVMSRHVTSCHVTSCHVMARHVTSRSVTSCHVMSRHVMLRHGTSCHVESLGTVTRPTLHCQLIFSTRNSSELSMTVFVGCPEGCRYHTASAVYDLVSYSIMQSTNLSCNYLLRSWKKLNL